MKNRLSKGYFLLYCIVIVVASISLSGCAMILSSHYQKVSFKTATPGASVVMAKEGVKQAGSKTKFDKIKAFHTVTVSKEGYKTYNYPFQADRRSPTIAFTVLNCSEFLIGALITIPLDFNSGKTRRFKPVQKIPELTPYQKRRENEKFIYVNSVKSDVRLDDILWTSYHGLKKYKKDKSILDDYDQYTVGDGNRNSVKVDAKNLSSNLHEYMKRMNFLDTTKSIFPDINNSIYLNATIKKVSFHSVRRSTPLFASRLPNSVLCMELTIEWDVLDYYKQKIFTTQTTNRSDFFCLKFASKNSDFIEVVDAAFDDNAEYAAMAITKELAAKGILTIASKARDTALAALSISRPAGQAGGRINDFMKSCVTIKIDGGHGSGVIIGQDGYIVTAYHVAAGSKKLEVVFNDGSTADAELIRKNPEADLALLKVKRTDLRPLLLSEVKTPEVGIDVWAIGTPETTELGQSVSKGIISALRRANDVAYLQTDVSINGGNSGGALINKDGAVLGIVTAKLIGIGTEGVGFAIDVKEVFSRLNIKYSN